MDESKQKLKKALMYLAEYPELYAGKKRFDYVLNILSGADWGYYFFFKDTHSDTAKYPWNCDYDVQKWMLLNESASLMNAVTLNGWSLFKGYYGLGQLALDKFRVMINEVEFNSGDEYRVDDTATHHIFQIQKFYKYGVFDDEEYTTHNTKVSADYYPLSEKIKNIIGDVEYSYCSIIPFVSRMIKVPYDDLKIYLNYAEWMMCVKFMYRNKSNEWVNFTALKQDSDYYSDLVILHAYAALIQKQEHENHSITILKLNNEVSVKVAKGPCRNFKSDEEVARYDDISIAKSFSRWLDSEINCETAQ